MTGTNKIEGWRDEYVEDCLEPHGCVVETLEVPSPLCAGLVASSKLPNGREVEVEHLLLNLPHRPRR